MNWRCLPDGLFRGGQTVGLQRERRIRRLLGHEGQGSANQRTGASGTAGPAHEVWSQDRVVEVLFGYGETRAPAHDLASALELIEADVHALFGELGECAFHS